MSANNKTNNSSAVDKQNTEVTIIDANSIRDRIYVVRGVRVMLDFDLAEIYGYTTSAFNQQIKRNLERFDDDFRFKLSQEETANLLSQNVTASWGGDRREPWAFTEQGIYMVMTVLKGELAVKQSKALIRTFQAMKDYIIETQGLVTQRDLLRLSVQTAENSDAIRKVHLLVNEQQRLIADQQRLLLDHDEKLVEAFERINETVKQSDISPMLLQFDETEDQKEYLLREGHPVKADVAYMNIYNKAEKTVYIVDNYIGIKTLHLLQDVKDGVTVTIFSDNIRNHLRAVDYSDFQVEFPSVQISFIRTGGIMHDRFIILDYDEECERIYHCGASSKDAAVRLTTAISELTSEDMKNQIHMLIEQMKSNPILELN